MLIQHRRDILLFDFFVCTTCLERTHLSVHHAWENFTRSKMTFPANRPEPGAVMFLHLIHVSGVSAYVRVLYARVITLLRRRDAEEQRSADKPWLYHCLGCFQNNRISNRLLKKRDFLLLHWVDLEWINKAAYHLCSRGSTFLCETPGSHMQEGRSRLPGTWQCRRCHRCTAHILTAVKYTVEHNPALSRAHKTSPRHVYRLQTVFPSRRMTTGFNTCTTALQYF